MESYKTVKQRSEEVFIEKRSKFIGYCFPVTKEEEALGILNELRARHWDATHNVYAYILREGNIMRYSDDGEPQGTAGMPVLDVLRKSNITDVLVVVTRYFGGILLGGGGLVRAYSHSASIAVKAAKIVTMKECLLYNLRVDYNRYTKAESYITDNGGAIDETTFDDAVNIEFHIEPENIEKLKKSMADLTGGKAQFTEIGADYYGIEDVE